MTQYASELRDFPDLLRLTGQSKNIPAPIVEKDYYLTRVLRALAAAHDGQFILKGGTSLSKGWQLLRRFSEDIDLLLRAEVDWGETKRHNRLKSLQGTCTTAGLTFECVRSSETGVHRDVELAYDSVTDNLAGLSKTVRLEAGYRGQPANFVRRPVQSMVAEFTSSRGQADLADDLRPFEIEAQTLSRTFVEKLFAAHVAYEQDRAATNARHYYDLYELCGLEEVRAFAGTATYRQCFAEVRDFSAETFPGQVLPEGGSFSKSPAFRPEGEGLTALEKNYRAEATLFFGQQPPLADVLARIGELLPNL